LHLERQLTKSFLNNFISKGNNIDMKKFAILMGLLGFLAACEAPIGGSTMVAPEASSNKL
jgi:hypothetical protein